MLRVPRAVAPLSFRFRSFEHGPLSIQALTPIEIADAYDGESALVGARIMAMSILSDDARVFGGHEDIFDLPDVEVDALLIAFDAVFGDVSPTFFRCDWAAWRDRLIEGARHPSNYSAAAALGASYDLVVVGQHVRIFDRPERFFGLPAMALTDGHMMAYRVARTIHLESQRANS